MRPAAPGTTRLRVMHVASGGFSGATQVALDLTRHAQAHDSLLVLRRKRRTPMERVRALQEQGIPIALVNGWAHLSTIIELSRLCRAWRPDVVVGHGFPEHLIARWAGWWARREDDSRRPQLVQVEHNMRERYSAFKRWQARRLQGLTAAFVGVSDAVSQVLRDGGLPAERVHTIHNGIALEAFDHSEDQAWHQREAALLMAARFGAQKDHETLIRALVPLRRRFGLSPMLRLAGGGSKRHQARAQRLVRELGLQEQVEFLGHRRDLPALLMRHRVVALSTHYEGLPLILAEAMAAGCAVVGSDVAAVRETLEGGRWGWLARHQDPEHWAEVLAEVLAEAPAKDGAEAPADEPDEGRRAGTVARVEAARAHARTHLNVQRMVHDHERLYAQVSGRALAVDRSVADEDPAGPWLSVLMPAHNAAPYINEALGSILSQVGPGVEVIVLDDGSTDDTKARIQALNHPQLRCLRHEQALGVSAARNALLEAAQGTWLWFIDADDRLRTGAIDRVRQAIEAGCAQALAQRTELDIVLLDHAILREHPRLKHRLRGEAHRASCTGPAGQLVPGAALLQGALARAQWHPWGRVVRRAAWPSTLRFPAGRNFEDLAVVPLLMARCSAGWWIDAPLIDYRSCSTSILGSMNPSKVQDWARALRDLAVAKPDSVPARAWGDHLALQAVRWAAVAHRMGVPSAQWRQEWKDLVGQDPSLPQVMASWWLQPGRWGAALKARRLGLE